MILLVLACLDPEPLDDVASGDIVLCNTVRPQWRKWREDRAGEAAGNVAAGLRAAAAAAAAAVEDTTTAAGAEGTTTGDGGAAEAAPRRTSIRG